MKRTLETAIEHLEKQIEEGNKTLFLHMSEWTIYSISLPENIKQSYREIGYDKVINPITKQECSALAYKTYPVIAVDVPEFTYI